MDKEQYYDLKDTIELMLSEHHFDRFKAEFMQLCIRMNKLSDFIRMDASKVDLPNYYIVQLIRQLDKMSELFLEYDVMAALYDLDLSGQYQYRWAYYLVNGCYPEDPKTVSKDDIIEAIVQLKEGEED